VKIFGRISVGVVAVTVVVFVVALVMVTKVIDIWQHPSAIMLIKFILTV